MNNTSTSIISAIVAMAENRVIGLNNQLLWRLPADLKHFKNITTGHPIIMGRKTFSSIGKPLPHRTNIVITRDKNFTAAGGIIMPSVEQAIQTAIAIDEKEIFIIGGAEIYQQCLPFIQRIYLTLVHHTWAGDAYFPVLDKKEWQEISRENHAADAENPYAYDFVTLERTRAFDY